MLEPGPNLASASRKSWYSEDVQALEFSVAARVARYSATACWFLMCCPSDILLGNLLVQNSQIQAPESSA